MKNVLVAVLTLTNCLLSLDRALPTGLRIQEVLVKSAVRAKFAITTVRLSIENVGQNSAEYDFYVRLPDSAFISGFRQLVGSTLTEGKIVTKEFGEKAYYRNLIDVKAAALLKTSFNTLSVFSCATHWPAGESGFVEIEYQEILMRTDDTYKHAVWISKEMLSAESIRIEFDVQVKGRFRRYRVPKYTHDYDAINSVRYLEEGDEATAKVVRTKLEDDVDSIDVTFVGPTTEGVLALLFDADHPLHGNRIETIDGFFIHSLTPPTSVMHHQPKTVIFVLDSSGSMYGAKWRKVVDGIEAILKEMDQEDRFNVLRFGNITIAWKVELQWITDDNIEDVVAWLRAYQPAELTNFFDAVGIAVTYLNKRVNPKFEEGMIVVLTDGRPSVGTTDFREIVHNITAFNVNDFSLHTVAFGHFARYDLAKWLSSSNRGLARRIYSVGDADTQLHGFFKDLTSLSALNISVDYFPGSASIDDVIWSQPPNGALCKGDELFAVGRSKRVPFSAVVRVQTSVDGELRFNTTATEFAGPVFEECRSNETKTLIERMAPPTSLRGFIERFWAHLKLRSLLDQLDLQSGGPTRNHNKLVKDATAIALRYGLVTRFTAFAALSEFMTKLDGAVDGVLMERAKQDEMTMSAHEMMGNMVRNPGGGAPVFLSRPHCTHKIDDLVVLIDHAGGWSRAYLSGLSAVNVLQRVSECRDPSSRCPLANRTQIGVFDGRKPTDAGARIIAISDATADIHPLTKAIHASIDFSRPPSSVGGRQRRTSLRSLLATVLPADRRRRRVLLVVSYDGVGRNRLLNHLWRPLRMARRRLRAYALTAKADGGPTAARRLTGVFGARHVFHDFDRDLDALVRLLC